VMINRLCEWPECDQAVEILPQNAETSPGARPVCETESLAATMLLRAFSCDYAIGSEIDEIGNGASDGLSGQGPQSEIDHETGLMAMRHGLFVHLIFQQPCDALAFRFIEPNRRLALLQRSRLNPVKPSIQGDPQNRLRLAQVSAGMARRH